MSDKKGAWKTSPAYKAYLALDRLPKHCPPFVDLRGRTLIHQGEVWCRIPGPQGLCAERPYASRDSPASCSDKETFDFYSDLMKDEEYEGKLGSARGEVKKEHNRAGFVPSQAGAYPEHSNDVASRNKTKKRKRQEAKARVTEPGAVKRQFEVGQQEVGQQEVGNTGNKTSELSKDGGIASTQQQRESFVAPERTTAEDLQFKKDSRPRRRTQWQAQLQVGRSGVVDLTQGKKSSQQEPTAGHAAAAPANQDIPSATNASGLMPEEQSRYHSKMAIATSLEESATGLLKFHYGEVGGPDENDLKLTQRKLRIRNQLYENQLEEIEVEQQLKALRRRNLAAE